MSGILLAPGCNKDIKDELLGTSWLCYAILGSISMVESDFHPAVWDRSAAIAVAGGGRGALWPS